MSKTDEAVDQLISVVTPLIQAGQELSAALSAANERAIALAAELAEFKATDAEEDARQLASQDEELAARTRDKTAKLAADIAAIQNPPVAEQPPTEQPPAEPEPEPAAEEPAAEPAPAETEEPAAAEQVDEGTATEDAAVIVVDEGASEGELGAGDPAVITPEVNTQPEDVELPAARRRR